MIDLSQMRDVYVDPSARTATVQGGATWSDVDLATQRHGLATTGGHVGSTGVGGLTLGGGFGWLHAKHGLASDNLLEAEVVTADGRVVRASEHENTDLFWGLRGGGGNFGVVTSFTFALHPLSEVFAGVFLFPREQGAEILETYLDFAETIPSDATSACLLGRIPDGVELVPREVWGMEVTIVFVVYPGATVEEGERTVAPFRGRGAFFEEVGHRPYLEVQTMQDASWQPGRNAYWKSGRIDAVGDGAARDIVEGAEHAYASGLIQLGGKIDELAPDATAFAHRGARFQYLAVAMWDDPSETDARVAGARRAWQTVEPHISGAFVNFVTTDDWESRTAEAYGDHSRRLAAIKKAYDPQNFFRMNANITPA
jgi:FAD/FMN-containing dehydrogenase